MTGTYTYSVLVLDRIKYGTNTNRDAYNLAFTCGQKEEDNQYYRNRTGPLFLRFSSLINSHTRSLGAWEI